MNLDLGHSVTYPLEDPTWTKKIGILAALSLIPGLNAMAWGGYSLSIARNFVRRAAMPLPNWDDWSDILVRGFCSIAAGVLYFLPVLLVGGCLWLGGAAFGGRSGSLLLAVVQCAVGLFVLAYSLIASLLLSVAHLRYIQSDAFETYFEIGQSLADLQQRPTPYLTLFAIQLVLTLVGGVLSALLVFTCIGPLLVITVAALMNGYILGATALSLVKT